MYPSFDRNELCQPTAVLKYKAHNFFTQQAKQQVSSSLATAHFLDKHKK